MTNFDYSRARDILNSIDTAIIDWHPDILDQLAFCVRSEVAQSKDAVAGFAALKQEQDRLAKDSGPHQQMTKYIDLAYRYGIGG